MLSQNKIAKIMLDSLQKRRFLLQAIYLKGGTYHAKINGTGSARGAEIHDFGLYLF